MSCSGKSGDGLAAQVKPLVEEWLKYDQNAATRAEIMQLVADGQWELLHDRLSSHLSFGTSEVHQMGVVIGHDHRHHSESFAKIAAAVFKLKNIPVYYFSRIVPTPVLAFATKHIPTMCGIMITASHNPKHDNGYKIYWKAGAQLGAPHDEGVAESIRTNRIPWAGLSWTAPEPQGQGDTGFDEQILEAYYAALGSLMSPYREVDRRGESLIVYTPMHGVGQMYAERAFEAVHLPPFVSVPSQKTPDPDFPTVAFPNPEEAGAFDEAIREADQHPRVKYILSNDPDADRFALAEKLADGHWHVFSGDEVGILLAHYLVNHRHKDTAEPLAFLATCVSSPLLKYYVEALRKELPLRRVHFEETLTGFKYLSNKAIELTKLGYTVVLAYEEALGYMVGTNVLDKDGISTMAVIGELLYSLQEDRPARTVSDYLTSIHAKYGYVACFNSYFTAHQASHIPSAFFQLRYGRQPNPGESLYLPLTEATKFERVRSSIPRGLLLCDITDHDPSKNVIFSLSSPEGCLLRLTFRASGTEPKLKFYSQLGPIKGASFTPADRDAIDEQLKHIVAECIRAWLKPKDIGLQPSEALRSNRLSFCA